MSDLNHHLRAVYIVSNLRRFYFLWEHLVYITETEEVLIRLHTRFVRRHFCTADPVNILMYTS